MSNTPESLQNTSKDIKILTYEENMKVECYEPNFEEYKKCDVTIDKPISYIY
jgi:hypothetical protein